MRVLNFYIEVTERWNPRTVDIELKLAGVTLAEWMYYEEEEEGFGEVTRKTEDVYPTPSDLEEFVAQRLAEMFKRV